MTLTPAAITNPVTGTATSSTAFGIPVANDCNFLIAPPIFLGYQSAAQSIPDSTYTAVTFDTEIVDSYSGHSTTTNTSRYTAQVAGYYDVVGKVGFVTSGTGRRIGTLYVNGAELGYTRTEQTPSGTAASNTTCIALAPVFLNVNDYVELFAFQSSGAPLNTSATPTTLSVRWVHT